VQFFEQPVCALQLRPLKSSVDSQNAKSNEKTTASQVSLVKPEKVEKQITTKLTKKAISKPAEKKIRAAPKLSSRIAQAVTASKVAKLATESAKPVRSKKGGKQERTKKVYQNFEFFYSRTTFRTMTNFFKTNFKPYFDAYQRQKDLPIAHFMQQFANEYMPGLLSSMSKQTEQRKKFLLVLQQVIFCH